MMLDSESSRGNGRTGTFTPTVKTVDPRSDPVWAELLGSGRSQVFHSPGWLSVLSDTYGFDLTAAICLDPADRPTAGVVYARLEDERGPRLASLPFSDFCDPLIQTRAEWRLLADHLLEQGAPVTLRCLHSAAPREDGRFSGIDRARWHATDVSREPDEIWDAIDPSARRSIRKARKTGVEIRVGDSLADVRTFFDLHLGVRKYKYGLLAQPWSFFENIWHTLLSDGRGALVLASLEGEPAGGVLFLEWDDTLYYKFNASSAADLGVRPNDLIIWRGIELAHERGLAKLDFGLSDWDQEGLLRFKRKYATEEGTIDTLRCGQPARAGGPRESLSQITELFTRPDVPDEVTESAGDLLYRYFA